MRGAQRLRALTARVRQPAPAGAPPARRFNDPPIFPSDALLPPSAELAVPAGARPVPGFSRGDVDAEWQLAAHKTDHGRTVLAVDGDVVVAGVVAEDGTVTVTTPAADEPPVLRCGDLPNNCPCIVIYSECRCPVRP